jgi:hypothetical protein
MSTGQTEIRSVAARVIAEYQGAVLLTHTGQGYQFNGRSKKTIIVCKTWPETERVLLRMKVPAAKIARIHDHLEQGSRIVLRPERVQQEISENKPKDPDFYPTKL